MSEMKTALDRMRERAEKAERERDEAHVEITKAYRLKQQAERERDEAIAETHRWKEAERQAEKAKRQACDVAYESDQKLEANTLRAEQAERERDAERRNADQWARKVAQWVEWADSKEGPGVEAFTRMTARLEKAERELGYWASRYDSLLELREGAEPGELAAFRRERNELRAAIDAMLTAIDDPESMSPGYPEEAYENAIEGLRGCRRNACEHEWSTADTERVTGTWCKRCGAIAEHADG